MNKTIKISYKLFFTLAVIYLTLPVVIFLLGYLKIWLGTIFTAVMLFAVYLAVKDCANGPDGNAIDLKNDVSFSLSFLIAAFIFALLVTITNGVGEYTWGPFDHAYRRAIFNDLINYKWPIIYDPSTQTNPEVIEILNLQGNQGFVYYFTYWLPAAIVGKLFGFTAGNISLILWNSLGIVIILIGMCKYVKKASYGTFFMFLCFSGLDVIPYFINQIHPYDGWAWLEGWVPFVSFISNFNNLENVYNQAIPCYLIVTLILLAKNNRSLGFTSSLMFAYSPWATIGILLPALARLLSGDLKASEKKKRLLNIFSLNNLMVPVLMLFVFGAFYGAKSGALHMQGFLWEFYGGDILKFIVVYILLFAVEVLPSFAFVVKSHKKDPMLWSAVAMLLILPFYFMSEGNNLVMRGSMPALFILCVFMAQRIAEFTTEDDKIRNSRKKVRLPKKALAERFFFSLVIIGMTYITYFMVTVIYPMTFMSDERFTDSIVSFGNIAQNESDFVIVIQDQFLLESPEDTFFFKYLAK